jgi:predicted amidohydrolase YtcJ
MLYTNARVYTLDARNRTADSVVVHDGRIEFVGERGRINPAPGEPVIDLGGRTLLPGLVDGHAHLIGLARATLSLDVTDCRSAEDVAARVGEATRGRPRGTWITGRGWDQTRWPGGEFPAHGPLSTAAPAHPVQLTRVDGHASWVNAAALAAAGITRDTADPPGGAILKDRHGEPTGVLIDLAQELVRRVIPDPSDEQIEAAIERAVQTCLRVGLVGVQEMGVPSEVIRAYQRLIDRGRFPFRNYCAVMGRSRASWDEWQERGPLIDPWGHLTVRAVKFVSDGALGSRGAWLHEPYSDDPANTGLVLIPPESLVEYVGEAAAAGFQACVHAIGDGANTAVLDAFESVLARHPREDRRFRVEHAQHLRPADIPRFRQLGALPSMQATHCTSDMRYAEQRLGPERMPGSYAWRSLLDSGVVIPGGSDFPVEPPEPMFGIHASVTRRPREGDDPRWQPEQRLTRLEALKSFTLWNAYGAFEEAVAGTVEPGKRADFTVLDGDPFTCAEMDLATLPVAMTVVGGEPVYRTF